MTRWALIGFVAWTACLPGKKHAADAGVKILEVTLGAPVGSQKGSVWPGTASSKPLSMHSVDGLSELTVRLPSGRVWVAKAVHSVIYSADEKAWTVRDVDVVYEEPALSWPIARDRVFAVATELGVAPELQAAWKERLGAMATGPSSLYATFPIEGCILLTMTIRAKAPGWYVSPQVGFATRQVWGVYAKEWPDTCR